MVNREVVRRRRQVLVGVLVALVVLVVLVGALGLGVRAGPDGAPEAGGSSVAGTAGAGGTPSTGVRPTTPVPQGEARGGSTGTAAAEVPEASPSPSPSAPASPDRAAGVLAPEVPDAAGGRLVAVPGTTPPAADAPEGADVVQVRVLLEEGLPADPAAVASTVMDVLDDPHGWGRDGWAFARTDGEQGSPPSDVDVVLASPDLNERMCAPLDTDGVLSCRSGDQVVLTWERWVHGAEGYGEDRVGYRRYLVSHEVGHFLGHGHEPCPGPGEPAPVMLQQTKGLQGCTPNPWPYP